MRPGILLMFALTLGVCGCVRPWEVLTCYEGPARLPTDVAVLLVHRRMLPVFCIRSIDGESVPEAVEYHLLPGTRAMMTGVSRGQSAEMPVNGVLRRGYVYRVTADVWNLADETVSFTPLMQRVTCDWRPRLIELGRFVDLTSGEGVDAKICEHASLASLRSWIRAGESAVSVEEPGHGARFSYTGILVGGVAEIAMARPAEMPPAHWGDWHKSWPLIRDGALGPAAPQHFNGAAFQVGGGGDSSPR